MGAVTYGTPELGIVAFGYHCSLSIWSNQLSYSVEGADDFLSIDAIQSILRRLAHGDDEDVAIVTVQREVRLVDD